MALTATALRIPLSRFPSRAGGGSTCGRPLDSEIAMIKKILESDTWLLSLLPLIAVVGIALTSAVARYRRLRSSAHAKKRHSIIVCLFVTVLAFPLLLIIAGLCLWPLVGSLPGMPWGLTDEGVCNGCALVLAIPVSLLCGKIYCLLRWQPSENASTAPER